MNLYIEISGSEKEEYLFTHNRWKMEQSKITLSALMHEWRTEKIFLTGNISKWFINFCYVRTRECMLCCYWWRCWHSKCLYSYSLYYSIRCAHSIRIQYVRFIFQVHQKEKLFRYYNRVDSICRHEQLGNSLWAQCNNAIAMRVKNNVRWARKQYTKLNLQRTKFFFSLLFFVDLCPC